MRHIASLTVWLWICHLTSRELHFLILKIEIIIIRSTYLIRIQRINNINKHKSNALTAKCYLSLWLLSLLLWLIVFFQVLQCVKVNVLSSNHTQPSSISVIFCPISKLAATSPPFPAPAQQPGANIALNLLTQGRPADPDWQ